MLNRYLTPMLASRANSNTIIMANRRDGTHRLLLLRLTYKAQVVFAWQRTLVALFASKSSTEIPRANTLGNCALAVCQKLVKTKR